MGIDHQLWKLIQSTDSSIGITPHKELATDFPDGPLRKDVIYHVASVSAFKDGNQCLHLTGMRVFWGPEEIPWNLSRFRKVDSLKGHAPKKRRRKQPVATA